MHFRTRRKATIKVLPAVLAALMAVLLLLLAGCSQATYDKQTISIEFPDNSKKTVTIAELRDLPQHHLNASYLRSTGKRESYQMDGPYLKDVLAKAGANMDDYAEISVGGSDGYYTLLSRDIIKETPDLMLANKVDGKTKLDKAIAPAQLAVQGQRGPYWVKMVDKITLYKQVQEKDITTVWVFANLTSGIKPYAYPYFGEKDDAIDLEEVWPLLDSINWKSFFTMKSSDGYLRNESLRAVQKKYYIKTEGKDAPINVAPTIDPAFGVKTIAWCSTDADAMVFPAQLAKYLKVSAAGSAKGIALDTLLKEVGMADIATKKFELVDTGGASVTLPGADLGKVLLTTAGPTYPVVFDPSLGVTVPISNLLNVREVK